MAIDNIAAIAVIFVGGEVTAEFNIIVGHTEQHRIGTTGLALAVFAMTDPAHLQFAFYFIADSAAEALACHRHFNSPGSRNLAHKNRSCRIACAERANQSQITVGEIAAMLVEGNDRARR